MRTIGVRELKAHLSRILREVQEGQTMLVTDRGRVVAELRRPDAATFVESKVERALTRLAATGVLRLAEYAAAPYPASPIRVPDGTAKSLLDAEREDR